MGWQNRDWAKHDDDELAKLYGVVPHSTRTVRLRIWSAVALLTFAAGAFAYTQRTTAATLGAAQPTMLIGLRGIDQSVGPEDPGGTVTVCSEETYVAESEQWPCLVWAINFRHLPVVQPPPYIGPCTHLVADRDQARCICLGTGPLPPEQLPPPVTGLYA